MLFNSLEFALFLPIVFGLFWSVMRYGLKAQNSVLLIASYVFYGWWDVKFLSLIAFSSILDFFIGRLIGGASSLRIKKLGLVLSVTINLGLLGLFKYYNFFIYSFKDAFSFFGESLTLTGIEIILPVGISFYTFQTLSYSLDIYKNKIKPTNDLLAFMSFVSFFPQLVAGPIERASHLLPQFLSKRRFDYDLAVNGTKQILWGLFKKVAVADTCAQVVNSIFEQPDLYGSPTLILGAVLFSIQIYGDFSGYSDIAIGTARLFGFDLMRNFAYPYFSRDIAEFWRRWHISLSTWFRDYLYIPLGGSRVSKSKVVRNTFIIFIVSGFWHGANWTFIVWGALNALYFLPLLLLKRNRLNTDTVAQHASLPSFKEIRQITTTYLLTILAWVFFRSESVSEALQYLFGIFSRHTISAADSSIISKSMPAIMLTTLLILIEYAQRNRKFGIETLFKHHRVIRFSFYYFLVFCIFYFATGENEFIYFQF